MNSNVTTVNYTGLTPLPQFVEIDILTATISDDDLTKHNEEVEQYEIRKVKWEDMGLSDFSDEKPKLEIEVPKFIKHWYNTKLIDLFWYSITFEEEFGCEVVTMQYSYKGGSSVQAVVKYDKEAFDKFLSSYLYYQNEPS